MATVAEQLHQGREARRLTIEQVADITKIRCDHLRALEEANYAIFPAPVYIRGFVRTYSTLLKLDVPRVMAELDAELGRSKQFAEPPPLSPPADGVVDFLMLKLAGVNWRRGVAGLALCVVVLTALLGVAAWRHYHQRDPLRGLKPATYQPARHNSGETLPLPPLKK